MQIQCYEWSDCLSIKFPAKGLLRKLVYFYSLQYRIVDKFASALNYPILHMFGFSLNYTTKDSVCGHDCNVSIT